jgi:riboflavin synthase
MTVTSFDLDTHTFTIDISVESLARTSGLSELGRVNLEKALRAHDRLGGHIVSGHVDGIGQVSHFEQVGESWELRIMAPTDLAKYLAYKGSITINGVSLTVNRVQDFFNTDGPMGLRGSEVSINLIPHTVDNTALGSLKTGSTVNLEIDTVARYVERMLRVDASLSDAAALKAQP